MDHILIHNRFKKNIKDYKVSQFNNNISDHRQITILYREKAKAKGKRPKIDPKINFFKNSKEKELFIEKLNMLDFNIEPFEEEHLHLQTPPSTSHNITPLSHPTQLQLTESSQQSQQIPQIQIPQQKKQQQQIIDEDYNKLTSTIIKLSKEVSSAVKIPPNSISTKVTQCLFRKSSKKAGEEARKSYDKDYEEKWLKHGDDMQEAADKNDLGTVYKMVNTLLGFRTRRKGANVHQFAEMLKIKCNTQDILSPLATVQIKRHKPTPTIEEVKRAVNSMSNGKASGIDTIPAEVWKIPQLTILLHKLICKIWEAKSIPTVWRTAVIVPVPKPKKNAHRPVSLLVVAYKIYLKLLLYCVNDTVEAAAGPSQRGFLPKRSTMDNINFLRRKREKAIEFKQELWIILSDVKGAFDTVNRNAVLNVLVDRGASQHEVELVKDSMTNTKAIVRTQEDESEPFTTNNGVPQGSGLSPGLFISTLGFAVNHANSCIPTTHMEYADDLTNIVYSPSEICPVLTNNCDALKLIGSSLEPSKTEIMHISADGTEKVYAVRNGVTEITKESKFEEVFVQTQSSSVRVLGDQLGPSIIAIKKRLSLANVAYGKFHEKVWKRNNLSYKTKIRIFRASIISIMTYGLKCHEANRRMIRKLDNFCLRKLKALFGFEFDDKVSYDKIDAEMSLFNIRWEWPSRSVRKARVKFFIQSLANKDILNTITPQRGEKRGRGRPKTRLVDVIVEDLDDLDLLREGKNLYTFKAIDESLPTKQQTISQEKAIKVVNLCSVCQNQILNNINNM